MSFHFLSSVLSSLKSGVLHAGLVMRVYLSRVPTSGNRALEWFSDAGLRLSVISGQHL